jgi:hypothetical protein
MTLEEFLACQGGTEVRVTLAHELQEVIRIDRWQPPVALFAALPRNQSGGALATESGHQSFHLPIAQTQCMRCGGLGHSMFHNLLEYLQPIEFASTHREVSLHRRTCKMAQKGTYLLGAMETSLYSLYKHCLSKIHKTCFLQSGNVV